MITNPEDDPPGSAYQFLLNLQPRLEKTMDERMPPPPIEIMGFHVDLSTIERGESLMLPAGWDPLAVAEKQGNDLVLILYRQSIPV